MFGLHEHHPERLCEPELASQPQVALRVCEPVLATQVHELSVCVWLPLFAVTLQVPVRLCVPVPVHTPLAEQEPQPP